MTNTIFINTDTQKCFMSKKSSLYKKHSERTIPHLKKMTDFSDKNNIPTINTLYYSPEIPECEKDFIKETNPLGKGVILIGHKKDDSIQDIMLSFNNKVFSNIVLVKDN